MSFFGIPVEIGEAWLMTIVAGGGALVSLFQLRQAAMDGRVGFKGRTYGRIEDRFSFNLYRLFWAAILFCSVALLFGWYFDLGVKP